jgi:hypothetical protein
MHNYLDVYKVFPPAYIAKIPQNITSSERSLYGWGSFILPYLDQTPLFEKLNVGNVWLETHLATPAGRANLQTPLPAYRCPSDTGPIINNFDNAVADPGNNNLYNAHLTSDGTDRIPISTSNYVMVANTSDSTTPPAFSAQYGPPHGIGYQNSNVSTRDIKDGTSNTLLVGERAWRYNNLTIGAANVFGFSAATCDQGGSWNVKSGQLAVLGIIYDGLNYSTTNRIHQRRGFSSTHVGGVHFVMCDGAVRFISENIDYKKETVTLGWPNYVTSSLARLSTRDDGQVIGNY